MVVSWAHWPWRARTEEARNNDGRAFAGWAKIA